MRNLVYILIALTFILYVPVVVSSEVPSGLVTAVLPAEPNDIAVQSNFCYLSRGPWLISFDVTDLAHPVPVDTLVARQTFSSFCLQGQYAYLAEYEGVEIIDISRPQDMESKGFHPLVEEEWVREVVTEGNFLYALTDPGCRQNNKLRVFDLSDPLHPSETSAYVVDDFLSDIAVSGSVAIICTSRKVLLIDVADPTQPVQIGELSIPLGVEWHGLSADDGILYISLIRPLKSEPGEGELWVVDISQPESPAVLEKLDLPGYIGRMQIRGQYGYVCQYEGGGEYRLQVMDLSDPSQLTVVGECAGVSGLSLSLSERLLCTKGKAGLSFVDISSPLEPVVEGSYPTKETAQVHGVYISGSYAYIANGYNGLRILEVSDPAHPVEVGSWGGMQVKEGLISGLMWQMYLYLAIWHILRNLQAYST